MPCISGIVVRYMRPRVVSCSLLAISASTVRGEGASGMRSVDVASDALEGSGSAGHAFAGGAGLGRAPVGCEAGRAPELSAAVVDAEEAGGVNSSGVRWHATIAR